ncbi:hypothetical protein D3C81_684780 [compost metagenome]
MSPTPVVEIGTPVIIEKHMGIDRLCAKMKPIDQRLAKGVSKRPFRPVGNGHADPTKLIVVLDIVRGKVIIESPISLHRRRSP